MCTVCGCNNNNAELISPNTDGMALSLPSDINNATSRAVTLQKNILEKNNYYADENRFFFQSNKTFVINFVSSPGAGKTSLLVETISRLKSDYAINVIEGDQSTSNDADKIQATGARAIQINTGKGCHLEAHSIGHAVSDIQPEPKSLLFIENVGNLVCPAEFDLGEHAKVLILSVTEGEDKPLKYPHMFRAASLLIINKIDLLPYVDFDLEQVSSFARQIHPNIEIIFLSVKTGEGMPLWIEWIRAHKNKLNTEFL